MVPSLDTLRTFRHTIKYLTVVLPDEDPYEEFVVDPDVMPLFSLVRKLSLSIETTIEGLYMWISNCPNMRSLRVKKVHGEEENQHSEWFINRCSALTKFKLKSDLLGDKEIAFVLDRHLERIILSTEIFGDLSFSALMAIAGTVTHLDLSDCPIITSLGNLSVKGFCVNLVHLKIVPLDIADFFIPSVHGENVLQGAPIQLPCNSKEMHVHYWPLLFYPERNVAFNGSFESLTSLEKLFIMEMVALEDRLDLRLFKAGHLCIIRKVERRDLFHSG
ncbi:hypothetical protein BGZ83_008645 [Gryganskiella cystojenkinii]|nr:hypothetical protein BGZ83_008645 [Gryganskiella cystojenkinii]